MLLLESGPWGTWKSGTANLHITNGVKGARVINWRVANPFVPWELDQVSADLIPKQSFWVIEHENFYKMSTL